MIDECRMRAICPVPIWLIGLLVLMAGCAHRTNHWHEDVQLSDGSVLTVDRAFDFELYGELGKRGGWAPLQDSISFTDPTTGRNIRWQADRRVAVFLDRIDGRYWLVASSPDCYPDMKGQRLLQVYVLDGSDWLRIEPTKAPAITAPNLVRWVDYEKTRQWDHVDLNLKREIADAQSRQWRAPEFLSFDLFSSRRCSEGVMTR